SEPRELLALEHRVGPDGPARDLAQDVRPRPPLVDAVVVLAQIVERLDPLAEAREPGGLLRAGHRAHHHAAERPPREGAPDLASLIAAGVGQRDVGPAGVPAR